MPLLPATPRQNSKTSPPTISALVLERVTEIRAVFAGRFVTNTSAVPPAFLSISVQKYRFAAARFRSGIFIRDWGSTGACFFDFDEDGKPDLFLVSATAQGTSRSAPTTSAVAA